MKASLAHALAAVLISALPAVALSAQGPCAEDVAKLCKGVEPGAGRMLACLKEHESSVSPACKEHLAEMKTKGKEAQQACHEDVQRLCSDVKRGGGRIVRCLKQHEAELSPGCKEQLRQQMQRGRRMGRE